jgi:hypothetical protein
LEFFRIADKDALLEVRRKKPKISKKTKKGLGLVNVKPVITSKGKQQAK